MPVSAVGAIHGATTTIRCFPTSREEPFYIIKVQLDVPGFGTPPKFKMNQYETTPERALALAKKILEEEGVSATIEESARTWACTVEGLRPFTSRFKPGEEP